LRALIATVNISAKDISDEYLYQSLCQWRLQEEKNSGELALKEEDFYNIAKMAGLFQLFIFNKANIGSIYLSNSYLVNGVERSERGFVDMYNERMKYLRTEKNDYPDDIVNEANKNLRTGLVPQGRQPVGYVLADMPVYDVNGKLIPENILPEPPADGTYYTPFYGEEFLITEETFDKETFLDLATFKSLYECIQRIRRNGQSVSGFLEITRLIGNGYIHKIEVIPNGRFFTVNYELNAALNISNKVMRYKAWMYICRQCFKLFELNELTN
jgi:hypothetical protein